MCRLNQIYFKGKLPTFTLPALTVTIKKTASMKLDRSKDQSRPEQLVQTTKVADSLFASSRPDVADSSLLADAQLSCTYMTPLYTSWVARSVDNTSG